MRRRSVDRQQAVAAAVSERLNALSAKTFEEIAALPKESSEELIIAGKKIIFSVWHDTLPSGEHLVALQAYQPGFLFGRMHATQADGFVINAQNQRRVLTLDEWAPFS